jgi:hypothetical protein
MRTALKRGRESKPTRNRKKKTPQSPDARRRSIRNRYAGPVNCFPPAQAGAVPAGAAPTANAPTAQPVKNLEKAADIRDLLMDNEIVSWFWFLTDVLPIKTNMNLLFQATLPLPHKLYEKVWGARKGLCDMAVQRPCVPEFNVMKDTDVTHTTKFGVFCGAVSKHTAQRREMKLDRGENDF